MPRTPLDQASLPIGTELATTAGNGFTVNYGVGAVMCMVKKPAQPTDPTECTTDSNKAQGTYIFTVTAVGNISGESAGATKTSSNSTLSLTFGDSPGAPGVGKGATIIASGTADLNGNGTFVTNPNGGGNGLPLTVWTRECVNTGGAGTVNSCYQEDWMRTANGVNKQYSSSTASPRIPTKRLDLERRDLQRQRQQDLLLQQHPVGWVGQSGRGPRYTS